MRLPIIASLISVAALGMGCEGSVRTGPAYTAAEPAPVYRTGRVTTRWVTLGDRLSADSNRQFINIGGRDAYRQIRIEAQRGAPVIKQVAVEFADDIGNPQVIRVDARLPAGEGQTIDLSGGRRPVQRIIVYTEPSFGGAYTVFGV
jgi:hypothetical protein